MAQEGGAVLTLVRSAPEIQQESQENLHKITKHHRKMKSHKGDSSPRNLSKVPFWRHRAWHVLYGHHEPDEIGALFRQDYEVFGTDTIKSELMIELHQKWANNTRNKIQRREAWYTLFADMTLDEIVDEINTVWLDPDYQIRIETIRIKVTRMVKTSLNLQDVPHRPVRSGKRS